MKGEKNDNARDTTRWEWHKVQIITNV